MATPVYLWDRPVQRFRDSATGRFIKGERVEYAVGRLEGRTVKTMDGLATDLRSGAISLRQFQTEAAKLLKDAHVAAYALARGGREQVTDDDRARARNYVYRQLEYLRQFGEDVESGKQKLDGSLSRRARMYGEAVHSTFENVSAFSHESEGFNEVRSVLGRADHCPSCVAEAAKGWVPIGGVLPIGERECLAGCHCTLEFRKAKKAKPPKPAPVKPPKPAPKRKPPPSAEAVRKNVVKAERAYEKAYRDRENLISALQADPSLSDDEKRTRVTELVIEERRSRREHKASIHALLANPDGAVTLEVLGGGPDLPERQAGEACDFLGQIIGPQTRFGTVGMNYDAGGRESYSTTKNVVNCDSRTTTSTMVHELGHHIEESDPDVFAKVTDFLTRRWGTGKRRKMKDIYPGSGYRDEEVTIPDDFQSAYTGSVYEWNGSRYASEVVSMGIQALYDDPVRFARTDPDFFRFMIELFRSPSP